MGLIKAAMGAAGGVMADQWKEFFYCDAIPENVLAACFLVVCRLSDQSLLKFCLALWRISLTLLI